MFEGVICWAFFAPILAAFVTADESGKERFISWLKHVGYLYAAAVVIVGLLVVGDLLFSGGANLSKW